MWKNLFRKSPSPAPPPEPPPFTLKARVAAFWEWFASVAPRFYDEIEAQRCPDLADEVSAKVDELLPSLAWVFGPGEGGGHRFTLSPEGDSHRRLVAQYWLQRKAGDWRGSWKRHWADRFTILCPATTDFPRRSSRSVRARGAAGHGA